MRREWTHTDKTVWGIGPWCWEPDKVQWIDEATDLDCLAVRSHFGSWCGYVGVPPGHPLHGVDYDDVEENGSHGGLTFADACSPGEDEGHGICHVAAPGRPAHVWWLGFDCNHGGDYAPRLVAQNSDWLGFGNIYRDLAYVTRCVTELAAELKIARRSSGLRHSA